MFSKLLFTGKNIKNIPSIRIQKNQPFSSFNSICQARQINSLSYNSKRRTANTKVGWQSIIKREIFNSTPNLALPEFENPKIGTKYALIACGIVLIGGTCIYLSTNDYHEESSENRSIIAKRLKSTYGYVLGGLGLTASTAMVLFGTNVPMKLISMNPWGALALGLACTIPPLIGTVLTDYHTSPALKHALWVTFNAGMAANLCAIGFAGGPLIAQAAIATGCLVGGLSLAAINADPCRMKKFETPLGIGLGLIIAAGLGNMIFPMPFLHNVVLYGGLGIFGGLTMTDTSKLFNNAKTLPDTQYDPINESLGVYLDTINIFIRMVQILQELPGSKKN